MSIRSMVKARLDEVSEAIQTMAFLSSRPKMR